MKCSKCGNEIKKGEKVCPNCGTKTSNKSIIAIICIATAVLILAIVLIVLLLNNKKDNKPVENQNNNNEIVDNNKKEEIKEKEEQAIIKKIDTNKIELKPKDDISKNTSVTKLYYDEEQGELRILAHNNNTITIAYTIYIEYLNQGKPVDKISTTGYAGANKDFIANVYNSTYKEYSDFNVVIESRALDEYEIPYEINDESLILTENEDMLHITYNNYDNISKILYIGTIYYKNNEIIYFNSNNLIYVDEPDEDYIPEITYSAHYLPNCDYNVENTKECYDNYKVFVSSAIHNN